jgi:murein DD-endopeptidase MepM/ murein hydrolase activator NlpD
LNKLSLKIFFVLLISTSLVAQVQVIDKKVSTNEIIILATNTAKLPYTLDVKLSYSNFTVEDEMLTPFIIPPSTKDLVIARLNKKSGKASYTFKYTYQKGNQLNARHEDNYVYMLPCGDKYKVGQGYFGPFSHQNIRALDFIVPTGSKVVAAREGIVYGVKSDSNTGCAHASCADKGNYVRILHDDGSIASYFHLKHKGVNVKEGEVIKKGQLIGYSGNTGYSNSPHLHFEVYVEKGNKVQTVKTLFKTLSGVKFIEK